MTSRRDALKLGVAGVVLPSLLVGCGGGDKAPKTPTVTPAPTEIPVAVGERIGEATVPAAITYSDGAGVPTFQGNPARTGEMSGPGPRLDLPVIVNWKFALGDEVATAPAMVDGIVYFTTRRDIVALSSKSGDEIWRFPTAEYAYCAPTVVSNVLFCGSNDHNLYAIDAKTGAGIWKSNIGNAIHGSPAVVDDVVYTSAIGSGWLVENGSSVGTEGMVVALDASTGDERWRFVMEGLSYCAPAVANGMVIATSTFGNVYALDAATGTEKWRYKMLNGNRLSACVNGGIVYAGCDDANLYALDVVAGKEIWRFQMGDSLRSEPSVIDGVVYFGSTDETTYAVDANTGREKWRSSWNGNFYTNYSPSVVGGIVYLGLAALNATTGIPIDGYSYRSITELTSSQGSSQIVAGGAVYAVTNQYLFSIGNLMPTLISETVTLRGAPSTSGVSYGVANAQDEVTRILSREVHDGEDWVQVVVNGATGWIPLNNIGPESPLLKDSIEYIYNPS